MKNKPGEQALHAKSSGGLLGCELIGPTELGYLPHSSLGLNHLCAQAPIVKQCEVNLHRLGRRLGAMHPPICCILQLPLAVGWLPDYVEKCLPLPEGRLPP